MKYPYYIVPQVEAYRRLDPTSEEAVRLSRIIAANMGDYASLRLVLGIDPPEFARYYPDMEVTTPSTMDTIDAFLDKFGSNAHPAAGYMPEFSPSEFSSPETIQEVEALIPQEESREESTTTGLSTLLKQRRYKEALEFIESQNLNNPQKSIYFAHQIRFLKKLISIEQYRKQTNG
ncbi:MAG: hypothetical protein J1F16_03880 [Muribaculaceae bacterium]|nr:hypothetical protein [Muribaculaceae bacterium]